MNGHSEMGLGPPANCNQSGPEVVFAQLAGAFYGEAGIPEAWRERVAMRGRIVELADGLVGATAGAGGGGGSRTTTV